MITITTFFAKKSRPGIGHSIVPPVCLQSEFLVDVRLRAVSLLLLVM